MASPPRSGRRPVLAVGAVGGGFALLGAQRGSSGFVEFLDGPTPDLRTLDAREFAFEFPAEWLTYDSNAAGSGFASIAVLGTRAVEPRCGDAGHVDINCVYEQPLEPGDDPRARRHGGLPQRDGAGPADIDNGTTAREIDGQVPAIRDEFEPQPTTSTGTPSRAVSIGRPARSERSSLIELRARDAGSDSQSPRALQPVIASFRFDAAAFPSPSDSWAGREAAGLPVISVTDAIAIRDAGVDDARSRSMAGSPRRARPLPVHPATSPVQPVCLDDRSS